MKRLVSVRGALAILCLGAGLGLLGWLGWQLLGTNVEAERTQANLLEQWTETPPSERTPTPRKARPRDRETPETQASASRQRKPDANREEARAPSGGAAAPSGEDAPTLTSPGSVQGSGESMAVMRFTRPGAGQIVHGPLVVLDGVSAATLARGPGHYPSTAPPGGNGNFAVAGHRTTHGSPFYHLDQLQRGDVIEVTGRRGRTHDYVVWTTRIVPPDDNSVLAPDPLGAGRPTLTLTTCHPRFSASQRLIVHAVKEG